MSTALEVTVPLPPHLGEAARRRFGADPDGGLAPATRRAGGAWQSEVRLGRVRQPVLATVGALWEEGPDSWRALAWTPVRTVDGIRLADDRRLPTFSGQIGLVSTRDDRSEMRLEGHYDPPGGRLGSVLDALMLGKLAEVTALQLLTDIADRLCRPALTIDDLAVPQPIARS